MNEKAKNLYEGITNIEDDLIEAAYSYKEPVHHKKTVKRIIAAAACLCICAVASLPVMAASGSDFAYDKLYSFAPGIAQKMKPVNEVCVDQGIELKVVSVNVENNRADILVSLKDVEENRINGTVDLFDSYGIHAAGNTVNGCSFVEFDYSTKTAYFLLDIEQDGIKPFGNKVTFSLDRILADKKTLASEIPMIDISAVKATGDTFNPEKRGSSAAPDWDDWKWEDQDVLVPSENEMTICNGVTYTGQGLIDGKLHLQFKYEDILDTDNHGFIYLKDSKGNLIECKGSVSFFDDEERDCYVDYIFDIDPETLKDYMVFGEFTTSSGAIEGYWEITFPVYPGMSTSEGNISRINAIRGSDEFNALSEYIEYLQSLEGDYECEDGALYDDTDKVKELADKYGLKYAKTRTDFSSADDVIDEKVIFDETKAYLKDSKDFSGYAFDDGNIYLEFATADTEMTDMIVSLNITPEGSLPWPGYSPELGVEMEEDYYLTTDAGNTFVCTGGEHAYCFTKIDSHYITVGFQKTTTEKADQLYSNNRDELYAELDSKVQQDTRFKSYWDLKTFWATGSEVTEKELSVYEQCHEKEWQLQQESDEVLRIENNEITTWLNKLGM